jgi:hypothetical protein
MSLTPFQTKAPRLFAQIESKKRVKPVEEPPAELLKKVKQGLFSFLIVLFVV